MSIPNQDLLELLDAALCADYTRVRRAGARIAEAVGAEDVEVAKQMKALMRRRGVPLRTSGHLENLPVDTKSRLPLVEEQAWPASPIFLDESNAHTFSGFIADVQNAEMLSAKGISTRLCLLLSGKPGTGKSLLAGHIAAQLKKQLYVVRLDSVISSLLGDTAKNIRSVFDFLPAKNCVLFLDEMDAIAKLRDDRQELGELKRVVNTLIQGLDSLDDQTVVVAATNHPQLLDPAIWRRFPYKIELSLPDAAVRQDLWLHFLLEDDASTSTPEILAKISEGLSGSDIQNIALAARRASILAERPIDFGAITWAVAQAGKGHGPRMGRDGLSTEQKKSLSEFLTSKFSISQADVARLLGVSRQAVSGYLKEEINGDDKTS